MIPFALTLALVAVLVVERARASAKIEGLRLRHARELKEEAEEYYHAGYRRAVLRINNTNPQKNHES